MRRKTKRMLRVEERLGKPLEQVIPETFNRTGSMLDTAEELEIPLNTLYRWVDMLRLDLRTEMVKG